MARLRNRADWTSDLAAIFASHGMDPRLSGRLATITLNAVLAAAQTANGAIVEDAHLQGRVFAATCRSLRRGLGVHRPRQVAR